MWAEAMADPSSYLPVDHADALLVGRIWSESAGGPTPVTLRGRRVIDLSGLAPTVSQLLEDPGVAEILGAYDGPALCDIDDLMNEPAWQRAAAGDRLLAPIDLQCIKACGVTFSVSALERIVEEQAGGDFLAADRIRAELTEAFGDALANVRPGTPEAASLKERLLAAGLWSQYLEVAIGPDAEVFTKAPTLSAVGWGDHVGIRSDSDWNNPEPEVVLICNSRAEIVGATLGNDVNLRDFEGRSALLLGKGKDNNASASLGPFIRLFDAGFTLDDLREATVSLRIRGEDRFMLEGENSMRSISRPPEDLVAQTCGEHHQYPDGFALYLGSLFAPTKDRGEAGKGFTHMVGDVVEIASPRLGCLVNQVTHASAAAPWQFGISALMQNLAQRGLLAGLTSPSRSARA